MKLSQHVLVGIGSFFFIAEQTEGRRQRLDARRSRSHEKALPQRKPHKVPEYGKQHQKPQKQLEHLIAVLGQGVLPGVHPKKDDGVIFIPGGIKKISVYKGAHEGQDQIDVEHGPSRVGPLINAASRRCEDQRQINRLSKKHRQKLPQGGEDAGENLEAPGLIEAVRQKLLDQRNLPEAVQDAVDPVGIFDPEGNCKRLTHSHGLPPEGPP